jgi:hypothetical protein
MGPAARQLRLSSHTAGTRPATSSTEHADSLVIMSPKAGSMTPQIEAKLRKAFANSQIVEFDPKMDLEKLVSPTATVIVAGGDGTIGWVVRRLADTKHPLGILSMGTFNNFAKSLNLPIAVDAAIRVIKTGRPSPITLGRVNDKIFLERRPSDCSARPSPPASLPRTGRLAPSRRMSNTSATQSPSGMN